MKKRTLDEWIGRPQQTGLTLADFVGRSEVARRIAEENVGKEIESESEDESLVIVRRQAAENKKIWEVQYVHINHRKDTFKYFKTKHEAIGFINTKMAELLNNEAYLVQKDNYRELKDIRLEFSIREFDLE